MASLIKYLQENTAVCNLSNPGPVSKADVWSYHKNQTRYCHLEDGLEFCFFWAMQKKAPAAAELSIGFHIEPIEYPLLQVQHNELFELDLTIGIIPGYPNKYPNH